jgi:phosphoribosylaminoimidazole-succinocarboxamide synthase
MAGTKTRRVSAPGEEETVVEPSQFNPYLSDRIWETDLYPLELIARTKVRDHYLLPDGNRLMVATDRLSAFDRRVASIPLKGQILTQLSKYWFDATSDIIPNHVVGVPDPNAMICKPLKMLPVEFVVRDYLTGSTSTSLWPMYRSGDRRPCGISLPEGLRENEKLPETVITPAAKGAHDEPLTGREAIDRGLVSNALWEEASAAALSLFALGRELAARQGILLVDTSVNSAWTPTGDSFLQMNCIHRTVAGFGRRAVTRRDSDKVSNLIASTRISSDVGSPLSATQTLIHSQWCRTISCSGWLRAMGAPWNRLQARA